MLQWSCEVPASEIPASMELRPNEGLFTAEEPIQLEYIVRNEEGDVLQPPGWAAPAWEVSPARVAEVSPFGTMTGRTGGAFELTARLSGVEASANFRMNPSQIALSAAAVYLNQGVQSRSGGVPLIAGRPGLLRIFVTGDQMNWFDPPSVKATLVHDGNVQLERFLPPETDRILTTVEEGRLDLSYDVEVPGSMVREGLGLVVEIEAEAGVPLAPQSQRRFPKEGAMELDIVELPLFRMVLVPTITENSPDSSVFDWVDDVNPDSDQMWLSRTILPVGEMEVEVHETFHTSANLATGAGWSQWIGEIEVLYELEGKRGYYYGVVGSSGSGILGLGNVGYPVSVGVDTEWVYTHEVGHTMSLLHSPCGVAGDPDYPYEDGAIGIWGYNHDSAKLVSPSYKDVMGYCPPQVWISDFQFNKALDHRMNGDGGINHDADPSPPGAGEHGDVLVVWGGVWEGELTLEPSFVVAGPTVLPEGPGPYRVDGVGADGESLFSISFSPHPLAYGGGSRFVFMLPYQTEWADALDRMVLAGPEGDYRVDRGGKTETAVLTDRATGRLLGIIRDWDGRPLPGEETAEVTITSGIPTGRPQ